MTAHGPSTCGLSNRAGTALLHSQSGLQFHHDPIDSDDTAGPLNPGTRGDVSVWLSTFRGSVASEPWAGEIDPSLIDFVTVPGLSAIIVMYAGTRYVGIAHVDDRFSPPRVTLSDMHAAFMRAVRSMVGMVSR